MRTFFKEAACFGALSLLSLAVGCNQKTEIAQTTQDSFQVIHPIVTDTVYHQQYVAEIKSRQNVEIRSKFKGFIEKIHVDEGQEVQSGQVLFTLNANEYKLELLKTQAQLKSILSDLRSAEEQLKNARLLVEQDIVSASEVSMAKAKVDALEAAADEAKANISTAKLNLSFTTVRAPFSGTINSLPNKAGSLVEEGTLLTAISDNDEVFAYFNLSEKEFLDFRERHIGAKNSPVELLLANNKTLKQTGKIETVLNELDNSSGTIAFRARFSNPDNLLKNGSSAKILLPVAVKNALLLPQKATFEVQDKIYVYVVDSNNVLHQKPVVVASRIPNLYVIAAGIDPTDRVLFEGIQNVEEGMKIAPSLLDSGKAFAQNRP